MKNRFLKRLTSIFNFKNQHSQKYQKPAIIIALIGIILSLVAYYVSKDISNSVAILLATVLFLVALSLLLGNRKSDYNREEISNHYNFLTDLYSYLLAGNSFKKSLNIVCESGLEDSLRENILQALKTLKEDSPIEIVFQIDSKDHIGCEIGRFLNESLLHKMMTEDLLLEFKDLIRKYYESYIQKSDISKYLYGINLSILICYLFFFMYEAITNL